MPKKTNPYFTFLLKFQKEHKIESRDEANKQADLVWRSMTPEEKKKYAGKKENHPKPAALNQVEIRLNEDAAFKQEMIEEISSELSIGKKYNTLSGYKFYMIHVNSFCYEKQCDRFVPCEIGIAGFSLEGGISKNDIYHSIIYPGLLPYGYTSEAKLVSDRTHQIPWEYDDIDNQKEIFNEVVNFLMERSRTPRKLPILYTQQKHLKMVKTVLDTWCDDYRSKLDFTVYNVETLFTLLLKTVYDDMQMHPEAVSHSALENDIYSLNLGLSCEFHENIEAPIYCARSIAVRNGYLICENCCPGLNICLIPGEHFPLNAVRKGKEKNKFDEVEADVHSTVREDSSDVETLVSLEKYPTTTEDSESSIGFPEYDDRQESSKIVIQKFDSPHLSGSSNPSNELSARTGSSGFSKRPAALPSTVGMQFSKLKMSPERTENRKEEWPSLRGRGGAVSRRGKGRGQPFRH